MVSESVTTTDYDWISKVFDKIGVEVESEIEVISQRLPRSVEVTMVSSNLVVNSNVEQDTVKMAEIETRVFAMLRMARVGH